MPCGVTHDTISGFTSLVLAHNPPAFKAAGSTESQSKLQYPWQSIYGQDVGMTVCCLVLYG